MPRALFEKTGSAVYISHLDLMRLFQRAFKRAELRLTHTQGYSPRPSVSIALPLSVGVESRCELLDFDLDGEAVSGEEIKERLNLALVEGVRVLSVYENGDKIKNLCLLDCTVQLAFDAGVPEGAEQSLEQLFSAETILVEKRGKNGVTEQNIAPMIRSLQILRENERLLRMDARICCQNPTLNPAQLTATIERYLPNLKPDFHSYCRNEIYRLDESIFR